MDSKNIKVLEALQMQPLSEEEKARRHILGRLWGPIATSKEKTRNGRGYNAQLWDKALKDEIFREKVANKSLFLELGHPVDREETDMSVVCACIPELPKVIDGDLYAYVDILDTKQGQLLKTLCDYGFVPGISSRGSGDIMANDEVDPETFFLETWDIVQLPAVKKARLTMCESFKNTKPLSKALRESLDQMTDEDRAEAEATLERLDVAVDMEEDMEDPYPDIPWLEGQEPLMEKTEDIEAVLDDKDLEADKEPAEKATLEEDPEDAEAEIEDAAEAEAEEAASELEGEEAEEAEDKETAELDAVALGDLIDVMSDYDKELELMFDPIEIDGNTIEITELVFDDEAEDGKIKISFNYNLETSDNTEDAEEEDSEADKEEEQATEDEGSEAEDASEEATDDGDEEVVESFMEMVRQKDALEEEVLALKQEKTVSDAEVEKLKEELSKYKTGFMRVSELASKSNKLQKKVASLNEQLSAKEATIQDLQNKARTKLNESVEKSNQQLRELQERLITSQNEAEATEQALREQVETARKQTRDVTTAAKAYKQKYVAVVEHYIASKATMLGVSTHDITSKLTEGYTLEDVDRICDKLLDAGRPAFNLGMGAQRAPQVRLKESVATKHYSGGYDIDDDLLELAGLK